VRRARGDRVRGSFESTDATDEALSRTRLCRVLGVARGRAIERTSARRPADATGARGAAATAAAAAAAAAVAAAGARRDAIKSKESF